jgi:hypothetical protein
MATISRRRAKWLAQIRKSGHAPIYKTFNTEDEAVLWASEIEKNLEKSEAVNFTLADFILRFLQTTPPIRNKTDVLKFTFKQPIAQKLICQISLQNLISYRKERLKTVGPSTVNREFNYLRNVYKAARIDWNLKIENPLEFVKQLPGKEKTNAIRFEIMGAESPQAIQRQTSGSDNHSCQRGQ